MTPKTKSNLTEVIEKITILRDDAWRQHLCFLFITNDTNQAAIQKAQADAYNDALLIIQGNDEEIDFMGSITGYPHQKYGEWPRD